MDVKKVFTSNTCIHVCSQIVKKTNECKCFLWLWLPLQSRLGGISRVLLSIWNIVLCFHSWSGCSGTSSVALCLITVLSYQPVEFSRKTICPSLSHSLSADFHTEKWRDLSLYFSLWYFYSITITQHECGKRKKNIYKRDAPQAHAPCCGLCHL